MNEALDDNEALRTIAVVGCGTVGASWAALFVAYGLDVQATDPSPGAEARLRAFVERAREPLRALGCIGEGRLEFTADLESAIVGAQFVQENAPENEETKRELLARIDRLAPPEVIVAGSTSSLLRSRLVVDCAHRRRHVCAHPFNPPHLVPLVEIVGEDEDVVSRAVRFYRGLGRRPIVLRREMPGHVANRLASALWREAVYLVEQGVASVEDIDAAVTHGPGLRWAIFGPHLTYHLGGGAGGIEHYLEHLGPSQSRRWASLGVPVFDDASRRALVDGVHEEAAGRSIEALERARDAALVALLRTLARS
ncbi:MAG: 3-hydroxyacyl-CoA dehydrogenase NAD-binding domain-containing protein [Burkholderiaceae bacterium]|nr:3-hydroxyacyl-CoA dehydrogenase NAD-binding domain-containing protein [Burkholderiaceae bacterium]